MSEKPSPPSYQGHTAPRQNMHSCVNEETCLPAEDPKDTLYPYSYNENPNTFTPSSSYPPSYISVPSGPSPSPQPSAVYRSRLRHWKASIVDTFQTGWNSTKRRVGEVPWGAIGCLLLVLLFITFCVSSVFLFFYWMGSRTFNHSAPCTIHGPLLVLDMPKSWPESVKDNEYIAMGTANFQMYRIPASLRNNSRLVGENATSMVPEDVKYMRCLDLYSGEPKIELDYDAKKGDFTAIMRGKVRERIDEFMYVLVWGHTMRECWLMTEEILEIQKEWAGADLGWMKDEKK